MKQRVYVRGQAVHCALGDQIDDVVYAMKQKRVCITEQPLVLVNLEYSRPYFRLSTRNGHGDIGDAHARFFEVLIRTTKKAVSDANLSSEEVGHLPIFFGSTAIDIPIYEETYRTDSDVLSRTSAGYGNIADELARLRQSSAIAPVPGLPDPPPSCSRRRAARRRRRAGRCPWR